MRNIHVLPTDKPSRVYNILGSSRIGLTSNDPFYTKNFGGGTQNLNIYITSDEEIKEGDWSFNEYQKTILRFNAGVGIGLCKKIILTTDPQLIVDGVQAIGDEFLEWFVKNPSCEKIDVNDWMDINGNIAFGGNTRYQIIIPKEEPKQETLEEYIKEVTKNFKDEMSIKFTSGGIKLGAKWQAEKDKKIIDSLNKTLNKVGQKNINNLFKNSAERMYSEEEVKVILDKTLIEYSDKVLADIPEWFEQFKKK